MSKWEFPDKLETFNPKGTIFEKVFKNQIALIAYTQYRSKHIISDRMNKFLSWFPLDFAKEVKKVRKGGHKVTLEGVVQIWMHLWTWSPNYGTLETSAKYWRPILEPMLPFINGEKKLKLKREGEKYFLVTDE